MNFEETNGIQTGSGIKLVIYGQEGVGKSSLANRLANKKRSIVSDVAGTTRDAIDTVVERNGKHCPGRYFWTARAAHQK